MTLVVCFMSALTHPCNLGRLFNAKSEICESISPSAPSPHIGSSQATRGPLEDPPIDMEVKMRELEDRVDSMDKSSLEEKKDLHSVLKRIYER